jgi:hypothetical protein
VISFKKGLSSTNGLLKCYGLAEQAEQMQQARRKNNKVDFSEVLKTALGISDLVTEKLVDAKT